jgi:GTP-binding protein YchF
LRFEVFFDIGAGSYRPGPPGHHLATGSLLPMERFGFVGLPNAGKSSLYNALAGGGALAAPYAFATTDPNVGVAKVFDERLDALAAMSASRNVVPASVQFTDIGGLVEGASKGEGLGNRFLGGIREVDAVVYVLRAFADSDVPGPTDPLEHLRVLEIELTLADLETVESQIEKRRKAARADRSIADEVEALDAALAVLAEGTPIYRSDLAPKARELLRPWFLLTNKPVLAIVNIDEDSIESVDAVVAPVQAELGDRAEVIGACIQLEAEAAMLDPDERHEMLDGLGLGEGALPRFVRAAYHQLGLRTFFTTGEKESRAWTFRVGSTAPECAGRIHSDLQRGFIRAEVIAWDELLEIGSWSKAREVGKMRQEGKDYVVSDGDVLEIRFNV